MDHPFFAPAAYSQDELATLRVLLAFDDGYYLAAYPDVAAAAIAPFLHFLGTGMYEHRSPWPAGEAGAAPTLASLGAMLGFDEAFYRQLYPDVPGDYLAHFTRSGMLERRLPFNFSDNAGPEEQTWAVLARAGVKAEGSFDRQIGFARFDADQVVAPLMALARDPRRAPKRYRNNFWMALALAFLEKEYFGAAALCYNFFYNYMLPMPALGNDREGIYLAARCTPTLDYVRRLGAVPLGLEAAKRIEVGDPIFLNRPGQAAASASYALPVPYYCQIDGPVCVGGTSMLLVGPHEVLYDYLDSSSERAAELKGPNLLHAVDGKCSMKYFPSEIVVAEAFSLLHDHGHNYFHWMIEVLPRYLLARRNGLAREVTLLIDEQIGHMQEAVLRHICGPDVKLLKVKRNVAVRVGKLHWVSDLSVNQVHTLHLPAKSDILISPTALALLREAASPSCSAGVTRFEHMHVVRHNVEFRRLVNRQVFRSMLAKNGFWGFDPGSASFTAQVAAFSNARLIVAEAGAALANMAFCQPGAVLVVLVNGFQNSNYFYLVQMADALGITLMFFECSRLAGTHTLGVHDDMLVHVNRLESDLLRLASGAGAAPAPRSARKLRAAAA